MYQTEEDGVHYGPLTEGEKCTLHIIQRRDVYSTNRVRVYSVQCAAVHVFLHNFSTPAADFCVILHTFCTAAAEYPNKHIMH